MATWLFCHSRLLASSELETGFNQFRRFLPGGTSRVHGGAGSGPGPASGLASVPAGTAGHLRPAGSPSKQPGACGNVPRILAKPSVPAAAVAQRATGCNNRAPCTTFIRRPVHATNALRVPNPWPNRYIRIQPRLNRLKCNAIHRAPGLCVYCLQYTHCADTGISLHCIARPQGCCDVNLRVLTQGVYCAIYAYAVHLWPVALHSQIRPCRRAVSG